MSRPFMAIGILTKFLAVIKNFSGKGDGALLARQARQAFLVNVVGTGVAFFLQVILARLLGAESFGQYVYAVTFLSFFILVGKLGLDTAALRLIPEYSATQKWDLARGFIRRSKQLAMTASTGIAAISAIAVVILDGQIDDTLATIFLITCALLPVNVYLVLQGSLLQAFRHLVISQLLQVVIRPVLLIATLSVATGILNMPSRPEVAITLNLLTTLVTVALAGIVTHRVLPLNLFLNSPVYRSTTWVKIAFPMLLITSFNLVLNQADVLMVGAYLGTTDAGIYSAVNRISLLVAFAITVINSIMAPMISQLYVEGRVLQLQRMVRYAVWGSLIISSPLFLAIVIWAKPILALFGTEFSSGALALVILAVARMVNALSAPAGYLMSMSGHHVEAAYILGGSAILNILLNAVLIPLYQLEGAAIASLVTTTLWSGIMVVYVKKKIGVTATLS